MSIHRQEDKIVSFAASKDPAIRTTCIRLRADKANLTKCAFGTEGRAKEDRQGRWEKHEYLREIWTGMGSGKRILRRIHWVWSDHSAKLVGGIPRGYPSPSLSHIILENLKKNCTTRRGCWRHGKRRKESKWLDPDVTFSENSWEKRRAFPDDVSSDNIARFSDPQLI